MWKFSNKRRISRSNENSLDAPLVEVFGSTLALLVIIFILVNQVVLQDIRAMLERSTEGAEYQVSWQDGSEGFVVITYPDKLHIIETNQTIAQSKICQPGSPFLNYVDKIYQDSQRKQLIFAILDKSVDTMAIARDCLRLRFLNRSISIGWIIANKNLLSTVRLQDLPAYIKRTITPQQ